MMMVEARQAERVRSFLRARIVFNNHNTTIDCVIKNISQTGAKIEIDNAMSIPENFLLEVPQKGRAYNVRLSWRDKSAIGVEFVVDGPVERDRGLSEIARLRDENRGLRASVARLSTRLEKLGQAIEQD